METKDVPSLFVYGTLMSKKRVNVLIGRIPKNLPGKLTDFHNYQLEGVSYPGAKPKKDSIIHGIVFFNLTKKELETFDSYEGDQYKKELVVVSTFVDMYRVPIYLYNSSMRHYGEWKFENYFPENDRIKPE